MPGGIIGIYGPQRSGKTLISYLITQYVYDNYQKLLGKQLRVFGNLFVPDNPDIVFHHIDSISKVPLDLEPKVVLLDEIYNGTDANDYRSLKDISIFVNTVGKQNCLFIYTSIDDSMVYNRIRKQCNLIILVKKNDDRIFYRTIEPNTLVMQDFQLLKTPDLFRRVHYDTNFIPLNFDWSMDEWQDKLRSFYLENYNISLDDKYFK